MESLPEREKSMAEAKAWGCRGQKEQSDIGYDEQED